MAKNHYLVDRVWLALAFNAIAEKNDHGAARCIARVHDEVIQPSSFVDKHPEINIITTNLYALLGRWANVTLVAEVVRDQIETTTYRYTEDEKLYINIYLKVYVDQAAYYTDEDRSIVLSNVIARHVTGKRFQKVRNRMKKIFILPPNYVWDIEWGKI